MKAPWRMLEVKKKIPLIVDDVYVLWSVTDHKFAIIFCPFRPDNMTFCC